MGVRGEVKRLLGVAAFPGGVFLLYGIRRGGV